jgi:hypothetical protein
MHLTNNDPNLVVWVILIFCVIDRLCHLARERGVRWRWRRRAMNLQHHMR